MGTFEKKRGHCGKNDGTVIWRSKSVFHWFASLLANFWPLINSINKLKYLTTFWDRDSASTSFSIAFSAPFTSTNYIAKTGIVALCQLVDVHPFPTPESLGISFMQAEQQKFWVSFVAFCFLPSDFLNALLPMSKKIFIGPLEWRDWPVPLFYNDNRYILSPNWSTSTIQKSNTPIKTVVTTTGILVKKLFLAWEFSIQLADLKSCARPKIIVRQMSLGTVLAVSFSKFVRQWRKKAASAEHCMTEILLKRM